MFCLLAAFGLASALAAQEPVAKIGGTTYETLQAAFDAAGQTETTIVVLRDFTMGTADIATLSQGKTVVLDLDGKTIDVTADFIGRPIINNGTLTLTGNGAITAANSETTGYGAVNNFGTLTVESGRYANGALAAGACFYNRVGATMVVKGGEVQGNNFPAIINVGTLCVEGGLLQNTQCNVTTDGKHKTPWYYAVLNGGSADAQMTMTGGTIRGTQGALSFIGGKGTLQGGRCETVPCVYHGDTGGNIWHALYMSATEAAVQVTVGGDFSAESKGREAVVIGGNNEDSQKYACTVSLEGGDFIGDVEDGFPAVRVNRQSTDLTATVTGGTFTGGIVSVADANEGQTPLAAFVSGGTFSVRPEEALYVAGFLPVLTEEGTYEVSDTAAVAAIITEDGIINCQSLQAAFNAATEGQTVTLLRNTDISGVGARVVRSLTLDLNGQTLSADNSKKGNLDVATGATLTLTDSTDTKKNGTGKGKILATQNYTSGNSGYSSGVVSVEPGATLVMERGLIDARRENPVANGQYGVVMNGSSTATIRGGAIRAGWYAIAGNGNDKETTSTITVEGGILESTADYAIYHPQGGTLTISGGTVAGAAGGVSINRGSCNITGGVVSSAGTGDTGDWGDGTGGQGKAAITVGARYDDVKLDISGGVITAPEGVACIATEETTHSADIAITGGTFSVAPPAEFYPEGYLPVLTEEGTYEVSDTAAVAAITTESGTIGYPSLQAAFNAATAGQTITLLANVTGTPRLEVVGGKQVTIDLNGHDIGFAKDGYFHVYGGSLTLTGEGKVYEQSPYWGAILIHGATQELRITAWRRSARVLRLRDGRQFSSTTTMDVPMVSRSRWPVRRTPWRTLPVRRAMRFTSMAQSRLLMGTCRRLR